MQLRKLNEAGLSLFSEYVVSLGQNPGAFIPTGLLDRPDTSTMVRPSVEIEPDPISSRLDAAQRVDSLLSPMPADVRAQLESDPGFWSWLSLYYFDSVCPMKRGRRTPGQVARHIAGERGRNRYRHLLESPYLIYRSFKPAHLLAMAVLNTPVHQPGEVVEQMVGRQYLIGNRTVVEAYTQLYFDHQTGENKVGAGGRARGCSNRYGIVLSQFDRTFDLGLMSAQQIIDLLPDEFDRYR